MSHVCPHVCHKLTVRKKMLKADAKRFENLASCEESIRVAAATQLEMLKKFHFEDHSIHKAKFSSEKVDQLVAAWRETRSDLVRMWIAQVLALSQTHSPEVLSLAFESLKLGGQYLPAVFRYVLANRRDAPEKRELIKAYHRHRNAEVRGLCAFYLDIMALGKELVYKPDIDVIRTLMLDADAHVRLYAVSAVKHFSLDELCSDDFEVLLDVVNLDSGAARHYAKELLKKMSGIVADP